MRSLFLSAALLVAATAASATPPLPHPPPPAPPPRLLVILSVDGLSSQMLERYRSNLRGGLGRLANGAVFSNGAFGADRPSAAIGDLLQARNTESMTVAVGGDRTSAAAIGGRTPDQRWYWQGSRFATDLSVTAPRSIGEANAAIGTMIATAQPPLVPPPACASAPGSQSASARFARRPGDSAAFARSPALDGAVLAVAAAIAIETGLGRDIHPDLLAIDLSSTAKVAQVHGSASEAACLQLHSLDRDLGDFLTLLDRRGIDYAVALTGGAAAAPAIFWRKDMRPSQQVGPITAAQVAATLAAQLGLDTAGSEMTGRCVPGIQGIACPVR